MTATTAADWAAEAGHQGEQAPISKPYVGLRPFSESEFALFFGRERETKLVASNLVASRLTLLYGPSGVGKSSLLQAAVAPFLRRVAAQHPGEDGAPTSGVVVFNGWRDDPVESLLDAVAEALQPILQTKGVDLPEAPRSLLAALRTWTEQLDVDLLLILDQFEEYFLYHGRAEAERFAEEFPEVVNASELRVNVLLSLREDALAKLDLFKGRIPRLFGNYLRTGYLDREAARHAITGPIAEYNRSVPDQPVEIEPALVEKVLDQVEAGKVVVGDAGAGKVDDTSGSAGRVAIETSHLQMVTARLWESERAEGSRILRASTLDRLGGAKQIVSRHLDDELAALPDAEREIVVRAFEHLVTTSGTKISYSIPDLADLAKVSETELAPVLEHLSSGGKRILRPVEPAPGQVHQRYEIFHDVLASAVLDWRRRQLAERDLLAAGEELQRERERARRAVRRAVAVVGMAVLAVGVVLALLWASHQRDLSRSREWAASAISGLSVDPARSVEEALRGLNRAETPEAEGALRQALADSHVRSVMQGHRGWVNTVAFNRAGDRIVTGGRDGKAFVWEPSTGRRVAELSGHTEEVRSAAFDPSGQLVLTAGSDDTARLWDASTGEERHALSGHGEDLSSASFDETGRFVVTTSYDRTARVWEAATGRQLSVLSGHGSYVTSAAFGPQATTVLTASDDRTARVWDAASGQELKKMESKFGRLNAVAFDPRGTVAAAAGELGVAYLWRWQAEGDPVALLSASDQEMVSVSFDASGTRLVTGGDKVADVWEVGDPLSEKLVIRLQGHTDWLNRAIFSPNQDESVVATASQDGTARLWDAETGAELLALRGHPDIVFDVVISHDGRFVATAGSDGTARFWERPSSVTFSGHSDWVLGAEYSRDGAWVVSSSEDGSARVWDPRSGRQEAVLSGHTGGQVKARFSPDGRHVVTLDKFRIRVWDWREPSAPRAQLTRPDDVDEFHDVAFAPDGTVLLAGDFVVHRWVWGTEQLSTRVTGHRGERLTSVDVSPDGRRFVTTDASGVARIWPIDGGQERHVLRGHLGVVYGARFSQDGHVVTASSDGTARVWSADTGREVRAFRADGGLRTAAFRPGGGQVVAGSADGTTYVWERSSGDVLSRFRRHGDLINSVTFSPDGQSILTAGDDRRARIYTCDVCLPLEQLRVDARKYVRQLRINEQRVASAYSLVRGDCYLSDKDAFRVELVACTTAHDGEVFATLEYPAGPQDTFDEEAVRAHAMEHCRGRAFTNYVGAPYSQAEHKVNFWWPSAGSWAVGDRRITCRVEGEPGEKLKKSVRGSGRS